MNIENIMENIMNKIDVDKKIMDKDKYGNLYRKDKKRARTTTKTRSGQTGQVAQTIRAMDTSGCDV